MLVNPLDVTWHRTSFDYLKLHLTSMKHSLQLAFRFWIGLTLLVIASHADINLRNDMDRLNLFIQ